MTDRELMTSLCTVAFGLGEDRLPFGLLNDVKAFLAKPERGLVDDAIHHAERLKAKLDLIYTQRAGRVPLGRGFTRLKRLDDILLDLASHEALSETVGR